MSILATSSIVENNSVDIGGPYVEFFCLTIAYVIACWIAGNYARKYVIEIAQGKKVAKTYIISGIAYIISYFLLVFEMASIPEKEMVLLFATLPVSSIIIRTKKLIESRMSEIENSLQAFMIMKTIIEICLGFASLYVVIYKGNPDSSFDTVKKGLGTFELGFEFIYYSFMTFCTASSNFRPISALSMIVSMIEVLLFVIGVTVILLNLKNKVVEKDIDKKNLEYSTVQRIIFAMVDKGLTIESLAGKIGISTKVLRSELRKKNGKISKSMIKKIADALDVSPESLQ